MGPLAAIEAFQVPSERSVPQGCNRALIKLIAADNDVDAIKTWLAEFADSPQTFRSYRKEAERLLLWSINIAGKSISSLSREDMMRYQAFLSNPQPASHWVGANRPRGDKNWKPFTGPLGPSSIRQALVIVHGMFEYLVSAGYLGANPLALMRRRNKLAMPAPGVERYLDHDLWQYLWGFLNALPQETRRQKQRYERSRWVFALFYLTAARISEVANGKMGDFFSKYSRESKAVIWWWRVHGKGGKVEDVPVTSELIKAMSDYRAFLKLPALPQANESIPLVAGIAGNGQITSAAIYLLMKADFRQAADYLRETDPFGAERLSLASTHWLRHTAATHQVDAGMDIRTVSKNLRHSRLETTMRYQHAENDRRHEETRLHQLNTNPSQGNVNDEK